MILLSVVLVRDNTSHSLLVLYFNSLATRYPIRQCIAVTSATRMQLILLLSCPLALIMGDTCSQKVDKLESEMTTMMKRMETMYKLESEMANLMKRMEMMETEAASTKTDLVVLDNKFKQTRDIPYVTICAFQDLWTSPSSTITYDKIVADFNNADRPNGGDGVLDVNSGVFTCLTAGHYTISYSGDASMDSGEIVWIVIYLNGETIGDVGS